VKVFPERGDIIWIDFNPQQGHEQAGTRPALVISNSRYNQVTKMLIACPITSQIKGYSFEIPLSKGLKTSGVILANQVKTLDWQARGFQFIEQVSNELLEEVLDTLNAILE
jgi:mRNA interferase MazF